MLEGKSVVITGSGNGIGAACARGAAALGARIVVNDVNEAAAHRTVGEIREQGGTAIACVADISLWEEAGKLIQTCVETFGRIDGLVNNAGLDIRHRFEEFEPKSAEAMVRVNVLGTMYCAGHAVKHMLPQKSGSIINVTSGAHLGLVRQGIYGGTKGAVASLIYTWALELEGSGVRVNGLSPFGASNIFANSRDYVKSTFGADMPEDFGNTIADGLPDPKNNSAVVEYLLSDRSKDINGQIVRIDRDELYLVAHPALLLPSLKDPNWTSEKIADAFDGDFKNRLISCGILGTESLPVELTTGFWKRSGGK